MGFIGWHGFRGLPAELHAGGCQVGPTVLDGAMIISESVPRVVPELVDAIEEKVAALLQEVAS